MATRKQKGKAWKFRAAGKNFVYFDRTLYMEGMQVKQYLWDYGQSSIRKDARAIVKVHGQAVDEAKKIFTLSRLKAGREGAKIG